MDIRHDNPILNRQISDYLTDDDADFTVEVSHDYIEKEIEEEVFEIPEAEEVTTSLGALLSKFKI
mgnify:CR=1 FL=1